MLTRDKKNEENLHNAAKKQQKWEPWLNYLSNESLKNQTSLFISKRIKGFNKNFNEPNIFLYLQTNKGFQEKFQRTKKIKLAN